ncbi:MAG: EamA family transporter [Terriglobales bacterium]
MKAAPPRQARGYLLIGGAACCWGASAALGRAMFTSRLGLALAPISPLVLTQGRISLAAVLLLPFLCISRRGRIGLPRRDFWGAVSLGVLGMSSSNYLYYLAIQRTNVVTAIILQYTAPIWVLVYLVARGRQRASSARVAAVVVALAGIALTLGLLHSGVALRLDPIGVIAANLAAFAFAYYNIGGESLTRRADPVLVSLWMLVGAAVVWLAINPPWRLVRLAPAQWLFLLVFGLLATLAPTLLYISGLRFLDPTRAVVTSCLEPVSGILLAAVFLNETLVWSQVLGVLFVLAAIVLVQSGGAALRADGVGGPALHH